MNEAKNTVGYTESQNFRCLEDLRDSGVERVSSLLSLDYCGIERCQPGYAFGPYTRKSYVMHIVSAGKGRFQVGGKTYHIHENQAFLIRPGIETFYQADTENPWEYSWVGFHGPQGEKLTHNMGFYEDHDVIDLQDAALLQNYISQMLDFRELTLAHNLKRNAFFALLIANIVDSAPVPVQNDLMTEDTYVKMAIEEIAANFNHSITVSGIAGKIGINRSYLSIIFKKKTGLSPQQFLIQYRMDKAAELLRESDLTIRAIAAFVGYADPLTFSKAFKKQFGFSPSVYRENPPALLEKDKKGGYHGIRNL